MLGLGVLVVVPDWLGDRKALVRLGTSCYCEQGRGLQDKRRDNIRARRAFDTDTGRGTRDMARGW